jgi:hypothetical protein
MKQGQQVRGGRRRHEVEKTCRRRPVELGMLGHLFVPLPRMGKRCRGRNLTGGAGGTANDFGRAWRRRPLAERRTLKEGGSSREETWSNFRVEPGGRPCEHPGVQRATPRT